MSRSHGVSGGFRSAVFALYAAYAALVCRARGRAALVIFLLCAPATFFTVRYFGEIHAGLEELLPPGAPSVRALEKLHARLGGKSELTVVVQSEHPEENRKLASELTARLKARAPKEARSIQGDVKDERAFIEAHAPLLVEKKKFDGLMDDVEAAVNKAAAESGAGLDLDDGPKAKELFDKLGKKLETDFAGEDRFPNGYIESADGRTVLVIIWIAGSGDLDVGIASALLDTTKHEVAAIRANYPADITVAYSGEVANLIEEHDAILADLSTSSAMVLVLVSALIAVYFKSLRAVLAVLLGLGPGLLFTFACGRLFGGTLNSNTAFLGSIIAGNGINYPILYLAYYRKKGDGVPMPEAIASAARQALPGTLGAAVTASAAYAGLAASTLRGFSQFGWLGAVGMVTTWVMTFAAMPIAIAWMRPPRKGELPSAAESVLNRLFSKGRMMEVAAGVAVVAMLFLGARGARLAMRDGIYDLDLRDLRNQESLRHGSASWDEKIGQIFGVWLNPVAGLVESPSEREGVASEFRRVLVDVPDPTTERVDTIERYVPPRADQDQRIARLEKLRRPLARLPKDRIPTRARPLVEAWTAHGLAPISAPDLPASLRDNFAELDGRTDRTVLVYPSLKVDYNDGANVIRFADALHSANLPSGAVAGGSFLFMAEIIRMTRDEAPRVIAIVCALVALVLLPFFARRPARILLVVGTVALVALSAELVMFAFGVRLNMLNFAAIPITIGVGSDYAVNLLGAMDAFELDAPRACAKMGGAILLCSLTTIVGYTSLLIATSGALRTFGQACVLGEIMAVMTVLLVLPILLRRRSGHAPARPAEN